MVTHSYTAPAVDPPRADAEALLERAADEGLPLSTTPDQLLAHIDGRHAAELAALGQEVRA